jgi:hypothetical protein
MANPFVSDTFTGTNGTLLNAHVGELGATWTKHGFYGAGSYTINANRIYLTAANAGYYSSAIPTSPDYDVEAIIHCFSNNVGSIQFSGRMSTTRDTMYLVVVTTGQIQLYSFVEAAGTSLGVFNNTFVAGNDYTVRLRMVGSSISVKLNGTTVIGPVTDTAITAAGRVGVRGSGGLAGTATSFHMDSISGQKFTTVTITPATETNTAQSLDKDKYRSIVLATEINSSRSLDKDKYVSLQTANVETNTAQFLNLSKYKTLNNISETDTAQTLSVTKIIYKSITHAIETNSATSLRIPKLTPAIETDQAQDFSWKHGAINIAANTETNQAQALTITKRKMLGVNIESDQAIAFTCQKIKSLDLVYESDSARLLTYYKRKSITVALEVDSARQFAHYKNQLITAALETNQAINLTIFSPEFLELFPTHPRSPSLFSGKMDRENDILIKPKNKISTTSRKSIITSKRGSNA